jgi:hypothetical protein
MEPESRDPVRDGRAIREIGKLANAPSSKSPPRKPLADHSGVVDLAAIMAQQPNWLDDALARAKGTTGSSPPSLAAPSLIPPSLSPPGSIAPTIADLGDDKPLGVPTSKSLPILLASTFAGVIVAGACLFAIRSSHATAKAPPPPAPAVVAAASHVESPAIPPPPAPAETAASAQEETAPAAAQAQAAADEPASGASDAPAPTGHHGRHGRHDARVAAAATPAAAPEPAPRQAAPAPGAKSNSALDAALRASMGGAAPAPIGAAAAPAPAPQAKAAPAPATDGRPERPSGSAVTSALTEALPSAKSCVASMSDASRALVTFGSDGNVHKVDVSGPAASDAKASRCLKTAFGRAHVPPFSASTYSAGVTVRP